MVVNNLISDTNVNHVLSQCHNRDFVNWVIYFFFPDPIIIVVLIMFLDHLVI